MPCDFFLACALATKKSNEKSAFQRELQMNTETRHLFSGNCSPEMPLDQTNSCLETEASGF
jgi:hypothetical protein